MRHLCSTSGFRRGSEDFFGKVAAACRMSVELVCILCAHFSNNSKREQFKVSSLGCSDANPWNNISVWIPLTEKQCGGCKTGKKLTSFLVCETKHELEYDEFFVKTERTVVFLQKHRMLCFSLSFDPISSNCVKHHQQTGFMQEF